MDTKRLIIFAALAGLGFVVFTQAQKLSQPTTSGPVETIVEKVAYQDILSASTDIPFGGRLNEQNIQWKQWPEEAMSEEYISRELQPEALEEFLNGVAKSPIYAGEPLSSRRVVLVGDKGLMSALLEPGMRAVASDITTESAAGGFIQPGDRVDIILTTEVTQSRALAAVQTFEDRYASDTIFENVRVLAIDQIYDVDEEGGAAITGTTATFEMSQEDAELFQMAIAAGDLALTLRPLTSAGTAGASSRAKGRKKKKTNSALTVYRGGRPEQVAIIRGQ
ncbi:Flp pilus assembly protein CpaB [Fretibacter rubidus]|uniref:Flp pilus assembly protein CpaB n=1 Tax=Fretibacter rubidus TaxID=570162 RepID=UPI00352ADAFA